MIGNEEILNAYIYLAAYKRQLGIQMEKVEIKMGTMEKQIGLTHPESIKLRLEGMELISLAGVV